MRNRKTSRILNDDSYLLGLSYSDISGVGLFLLALLIMGKLLGITSMLWALIAALSVLVVLIPIRLRLRRRILRDSFKYLIFHGVLHVSKNHRK